LCRRQAGSYRFRESEKVLLRRERERKDVVEMRETEGTE
jgi:hypothetical protein